MLYVRSPCLVDPQVNAKFHLPCLQQNLAIIYSYAATSSKNLWPTGECAFYIQFRRRRRDSPSMSRGHKNTKNECETRLCVSFVLLEVSEKSNSETPRPMNPRSLPGRTLSSSDGNILWSCCPQHLSISSGVILPYPNSSTNR